MASNAAHDFGEADTNDTGRSGHTFFADSDNFKVQSIEEFEVLDSSEGNT
jgi:hypothetical protein